MLEMSRCCVFFLLQTRSTHSSAIDAAVTFELDAAVMSPALDAPDSVRMLENILKKPENKQNTLCEKCKKIQNLQFF